MSEDPETVDGLALNRRQRNELNEWGFTVLESHFQGEELAEMVSGVEKLRKVKEASTSISSDGVAAVDKIDDLCLHIVDHPRILPYVVDAMGWNIHSRDCLLNFNLPGQGAAKANVLTLPWHFDQEEELTGITQDGVLPLIELKVSLYLSDHTEDGHACTLIVPGSHHWTPAQRASWEDTMKPSDVVPLRLPIGSVLLWRSSVLHSVAPHTAMSHRYHLFVSYVPRWIRPSHRGNFSTVTHADPATDKELLTRSSPVRRQLLGAMGDLSETEPSQYWFPHKAEQLPLKAWVEEKMKKRKLHRWGVTGNGVSFTRVLFPAQKMSLQDRLDAARCVLDENSPQFQRMKDGMGYRNLMNADMESEWHRKNAWKNISISGGENKEDKSNKRKRADTAEDSPASTLVKDNARLVEENRRLLAELASLKR